jgi:isoamylase
MTGQDWGAAYARAVTVALSGDTGDHTRPDDPFLMMLNAWWEPLDFTIPEPLRAMSWQVEVDTNTPDVTGRAVDTSAPVTLIGRSLVLLRSPQTEPAG